MSIPPISKLKKLAEEIVTEARKDRTLSSLTPRLIRQKIEEKATLKAGSLDDNKYKGPIGDAIKVAQSKTSKARNEDTASTSGPYEEDNGNRSANSDQTREKPKGKKRKSNAANSTSHAASAANNQKFKSAEFIPTSDIEADEPSISGDVGEVPNEGEDIETSKRPLKKRKKSQNTEPISSSSHKPDSGSSSKRPSSPTVVEDSKAESDLSDLSDVVDEPPKAKRQSNGKEKSDKTAKKKKIAPALSKDEGTIKRLKGFVNACGVRKVWSKVFEGVEDQPSKQIKILKHMLADLGMTGRLSMEQAKAIKEKRDLALELEDVQSFEKAVLRQGSRRSRKATPTKEKQDEEHSESEEEEEEEEEDTKPVKRKNARQSIMAFLEDQSDSD